MGRIFAPWFGADKPAVRWRRVTGGCVLCLAVLFIYWPALRGSLLWDDAYEFAANPVLRDPGGLAKIWRGVGAYDYYPLKTTLEWVLWRVWGNDVLGWHLLNIALHASSAAILWRVLGKLGIRHAFLGALVFAVHPMAVESVAWMAEIKNATALPLALLSFSAFLDFQQRGCRRDWIRAFALFIAALLCKSAVVALPVVLLIFLVWHRRRTPSFPEMLRLAPFFAAALALGLVTISFQHHRAIVGAGVPLGSIGIRLSRAGAELQFYFGKAIWPLNLMPIYPKSVIDSHLLAATLGWAGIALTAVVLLWRGRPLFRAFLAAALAYAAMLLPILGFIRMPYMEFSWVADHYAYPALPAFALVVAGALDRCAEQLPRRWLRPASAVLVAGCAVWMLNARLYAASFRSGPAFWLGAYRCNPDSGMTQYGVGKVYLGTGDLVKAAKHFSDALRRDPTLVNARIGLATTLEKTGRTGGALEELRTAVAAAPDYAPARAALGSLLLAMGEPAAAEAEFDSAVRLEPWSARNHNNLGAALVQIDRLTDARTQFETALRLDPALAAARSNLEALAASGPGKKRKR